MKTNPNDPVDWSRFITGITKLDGTFIKGAFPGLTKREYFAAMAMQGMLSFGNGEEHYLLSSILKEAVLMADALIAELNKEGEE